MLELIAMNLEEEKLKKKGISFSSVVSGNKTFKENEKCPNNNNSSI